MQRYFGVMRPINKRGCKKLLDTISSEPRESVGYSSMEMDKKASRPGCTSILRKSGIPKPNKGRKEKSALQKVN